MTTSSRFTASSFFAGIGGFELGLKSSGFQTTFQCENNSFCGSILQRHWAHTAKSPDITKLTPSEVPPTDLWTGGFPCQDVSVARGWLGRDGLKGKNTGLFFPFYNLVREREPQVVLLENVLGLLSSHTGRDFFIILKLLTQIGYGVAWRVLNTRYFGAPQSRPRIYLVAWKGRPDLAVRSLFEDQPPCRLENPRLGFLREQYHQATGAYVPEIAYCLAATSGRHTGTDWSRSYVSYTNAVRRLTPLECEGLQGFPAGWTHPHDDSDLSHEDTDTLRYHALGNAVSVPTVRWIGARIANNLRRPGNHYSTSSNGQDLPDLAPDLRRSTRRIQRLDHPADRAEPARWKSGGVAFGEYVVDAPVSPAPVETIKSSFLQVLETGPVHSKYFLSPNAAQGILRRVDGQGRTLFPPLRSALERLSGLHDPPSLRQLPVQLELHPAA